ncbi:adenylyl-sulfate kinase [Maridesulfovibrio salexigens]|uniref:Adenylyl-sulfate kinase n=1 Tax=Maridesulfovibrio salexigens (strain ATCC 14822 / DSM 2638 / NCIMB 8403 / VKM B-1763) TaxID=526222 RepID=C6BTZ0_MARSD|nr:adenylyl-sulfate kinase [Maridesulfovibrio salexigens]ACS81699.1 adenylylsulfate kinase [Maridesulfovibrio salexigens DSM 2638]
MSSERNVLKYRGKVFRGDREKLNGHRSAVFWFTGLSGSGKSTIAHEVEKKLFDLSMRAYVFDGDNVRHGLCGDLSFSPAARTENIRRIAEVSKLFTENGTICMCAFISPLKKYRQMAREIIGKMDFYEIYITCPLEVCERRDVKGYYKLAREGKIKNYTGISASYETPEAPDLVIDTDKETLEESVGRVKEFILGKISF